MNSDGPQSQTFPEVFFVKLSHLDTDMPYFIEEYPVIVAITTITAEW